METNLWYEKLKKKRIFICRKDKEKFHGIAPFNMETGATTSKLKTYSSIFGEEMVKLGEEDENIYTIVSGMVKGTGLGEFFQKFENRAIDIWNSRGT